MSREQLRETLERVFGYYTERAEALYELGVEATGPIVEVGSSRGFGATCLAFGSIDGMGHTVYCIDPHAVVRGWAGEPYGPADRELFYGNITKAGVGGIVALVSLPVQHLNTCWPYRPGLTVWDTGQRLSVCGEWLDHWFSMMPKGSVLAINETGAGDLGVDRWISDNNLRLREIKAYMRIMVR